MITSECRPKTFDEMAGQRLCKVLLKNIIEKPEAAPKTLIFYGAYGTGKTTSARIFARALNCQGAKKPCMKCPNCLADIDESSYYREYDSSIMGKVDKIRELRDTFYVSSSKGWQVIVFDEVHLVSSAAQGALLKILEESPPRTFFILCTTDPDKLLNTIKSRSLEVKFEAVPFEDVVANVKGICIKRNLGVSDEIVSLIAKKSKGHMRDAHKYIDQYCLVGEEGFKEVFKSCKDSFYSYFEAIAQKDKEKVFKSIQEIIQFPLAESKDDFQEVVLSMAKQMVDIEQEPRCKSLVSTLGADVLKLVKVCVADWVTDGFSSDIELQTTLLCVYQMVTQSMGAKGPASQSIYDRAGRR